ncbi:hypothetical protein D9758_011907 [Tetrapyrgos nigripes]|uniref:GmrSD restriction endonucleases N-terminal domain-containing protein n=1 Tax=Tetrapyrgos nigripes TaxID=182062 RepID=A0A8H5CPX2_9AGAR|nr:hypothetical protein D9758_011907 [Tetrapyrgos nigripes]
MPAARSSKNDLDDEYTLADAQNRSMGTARQISANRNKSGDVEMDGLEEDYKLQKALKPPRATTYTAQALYEQIQSRDIDLEPEYQRDVVWTESKQIGLIDSILRNFYIPPIIFAVNAFDDGFETKTCIDGKQRLTSMFKFMDGLIPHRDPSTNEKFWYKRNPEAHQNSTRKVRLLPDQYRRLFANKQIVCVEYQDLTDANERDIFQRVQLGMALTPAEKLHVINTPRANFIRSLLSSYVEGHSLGDARYMPWERSRGSDFRCVAQAVFVMSKWGSNSLLGAGSLPQVERWLIERGKDDNTSKASAQKKKRGPGRPRKVKVMEQDDEIDEQEIDEKDNDGDYTDAPEVPETFARKVRETYEILGKLAETERLNQVFHLPHNPKVSPIEMICIATLIFVHGVNAKANARLSLEQLSNTIGEMRAKVRAVHKDIRMNDRVGKTMIEFIRNFKTPLPTLPSMPMQTDDDPMSVSVSGSAVFVDPSNKCKRESNSISHRDGEYNPPSSSPTKPTLKRKIAALEQTGSQSSVRQIPPPPPWATLPSRPDSPPSPRADRLSIRELHRRNSPPNPQRLPSPEQASAFSPFVAFQKHGQQQPASGAPTDREIKREAANSSLSSPTSSHPDFMMTQQVLGFQMMGIAPSHNRP